MGVLLLAPAALAQPDAKVWENYDFVPGDKILFYTDFSEDRVGNFARGLRYVSGPVEVVERDGVKVLRSTGRSTMLIPVGGKLPARFTLEFDMFPTGTRMNDQLVFEGGRELDRGNASAEVKALATVATDSYNDEGFAKAMERFVLGS